MWTTMMWAVALSFTLGMLLDTAVKRRYSNRLERALVVEREQTRVAEWLAAYNFGLYSAAFDMLNKRCGVGYLEFTSHVKLELAEPMGRLNQLVPTECVPPSLLEAAAEYNYRAVQRYPQPYVSFTQDVDAGTMRVRQLEDAVAAMRWGDHLLLHDYARINHLAKQAGTSYLVAETVLRVLLSDVRRQADHILGLPDPEEILPSVY